MRAALPALLLPALLLVACGQASPCDEAHPETPVVLNEVSPHGRDWVELYNPSAEPADLSGWIISDDPDRDSHRYHLPEGTVIEAGGRLVVFEESVEGEGDGFPFGLKAGEVVSLVEPGGCALRNADIGEVPEEHTWGRHPDASGAWQVTPPTRARANEPLYELDSILFDPESLTDIELELGQRARIALGDEPDVNVTGEVRFLKDGEELAFGEVGVRLRGGDTYRPLSGKASFKLSFDEREEDGRLLGLRRLTLAGMVRDPTMMRETLAYRLFRQRGVPAARTGYARVSVDGEDYGLYLVLESYDSVAMAARFPSTGHVYEVGADLHVAQAATLEVDEGDPRDRADIEALLAIIEAEPGAAWMEGVSPLLDLEAFARMWAVETAVGHSEGYAYSASRYYLHSDEEGRFTMLPSALDLSFVETLDPSEASSLVAARCGATEDCRASFGEELAKIDLAALATFARRLSAALAPLAESDSRAPFSLTERENATDALLRYLD